MKKLYKRTQLLMGAPFEVTAFGDEVRCLNAVEAALKEAARIERCFTIYHPERPLARLNCLSKKGFTDLDPEILDVLSESIRFAEESGGAFDPTAGALVGLWGFGPGGEISTPPSEEAISSSLQSVGYRFLKVHPGSSQLECLKDKMMINLGGIAKGYAVDRAVQVLKNHKIQRGLVSCGSTLYGFGEPGWQIVIQHPRENGRKIEVVCLSDQALATSGDYERCFFHNEKRYSHLIDPRTGHPVTGMASVSVIAKTAMAADALSTAAFVLKSEDGKRFLEGRPGVEGLIITEDSSLGLRLHPTKGWTTFIDAKPLSRRRFIAVASVAVLGFLLPGGLLLPDESEAYRFATEKEALQRMFSDADRFESEKINLSQEQLSRAQNLAGKGFRRKDYTVWIGLKGEEALGYAIKLNVIGKKRPITFLIGSDTEVQVRGVEVLIYRESKGSQVRYPRFMSQFHQKTTEDPLRLGQDIRPISGATLSSRATAYAVRKALAIFEVVFKSGEVH